MSVLRAPLAALALSVAFLAAYARADDDGGAPRALMTCERADAPGRVRCEVEATPRPGLVITWGDVVIAKTPPFVSALRGRIAPADAMVRRPDAWRWAMALVARAKGAGDVEARVRLVVCEQEPPDAGTTHDVCVPYEVPVTGRLVVGE
jgi:hypothetical protein